MIDRQYPKVTIVSTGPLRHSTSNGILMRSLFGNWPQERLSQIYFRIMVPHLPDSDICQEYRVIGLSGSVRRVEGKTPNRDVSTPASTLPDVSNANRYQRFVWDLKTKKNRFDWIWTFHELWASQFWMVRAVEQQLRDLRPDIVYVLLDKLPIAKITTLACERLGIPLYIHVADDYVTARYQDRPLAAKLARESQYWFRRAIDQADGLAGISPSMASEYSQRYQRDWSWFTTLVDADVYNPSPSDQVGPMRLVFAGTLELARWESLRSLALALQQLNEQGDIEARLLIYSSPDQIRLHRSALDIPQVTELRGWVPPSELPQIFHEADVLVHVESFQAIFSDFTKFSFSTKLSQYMMAQRPILAFGPHDIGSIRVLRDTGAALVIDQDDSEMVLADLCRLLTEPDLRNQLAQNGRKWAMENVEVRTGQERFRSDIMNAIGA